MFFGLFLPRHFSSCCLGCVCVRGAELSVLVHQQGVHQARMVLGLQVVAWPCPRLCNARCLLGCALLLKFATRGAVFSFKCFIFALISFGEGACVTFFLGSYTIQLLCEISVI